MRARRIFVKKKGGSWKISIIHQTSGLRFWDTKIFVEYGSADNRQCKRDVSEARHSGQVTKPRQ